MRETEALEGVRLVDAGLLVQGPQAALMLAEFGADVIKVELPGFGDQARWIPLSATDLRAPYYEACNRGKRSVTIDLRVPAGREAFLDLVDRSRPDRRVTYAKRDSDGHAPRALSTHSLLP